MLKHFAAVLGSMVLVAACASRPAPVVPEPVYDKFGKLEDVCVSDSQMRDPNYQPPLRPLPRCEERCQPNEQPTFTVAGQWPICVPRQTDDGGDDNDNQQPRSPNDPTRG